MPQGLEFYLGQIVTALAIQIAQKAQEADRLREELEQLHKELAAGDGQRRTSYSWKDYATTHNGEYAPVTKSD